jgi:hypothetical protein
MKEVLIQILKTKTVEAIQKLETLNIESVEYTTCISNMTMNLQILQAHGVVLTKEDFEKDEKGE